MTIFMQRSIFTLSSPPPAALEALKNKQQRDAERAQAEAAFEQQYPDLAAEQEMRKAYRVANDKSESLKDLHEDINKEINEDLFD